MFKNKLFSWWPLITRNLILKKISSLFETKIFDEIIVVDNNSKI